MQCMRTGRGSKGRTCNSPLTGIFPNELENLEMHIPFSKYYRKYTHTYTSQEL